MADRLPQISPRVSGQNLARESISLGGPGGFVRQGPGDTQAPIPPAPPRRLVPAKPSAEVADKTSLLDLNDRICRWPMGHPGEPDFHFCGNDANPGNPYCVDHCGVAYQAQLPRRDRRPPPRFRSAARAFGRARSVTKRSERVSFQRRDGGKQATCATCGQG